MLTSFRPKKIHSGQAERKTFSWYIQFYCICLLLAMNICEWMHKALVPWPSMIYWASSAVSTLQCILVTWLHEVMAQVVNSQVHYSLTITQDVRTNKNRILSQHCDWKVPNEVVDSNTKLDSITQWEKDLPNTPLLVIFPTYSCQKLIKSVWWVWELPVLWTIPFHWLY